MNRSIHLKTQMLLNNLIMIILPALILGCISLYLYGEKTKQDIQYDNIIVAKYIDNNVANFIENPINMMAEIGRKFKYSELKDSENINNYLGTIIDIYPYFDTIQVLNEEGTVQNIVPYDNNHVGTNMFNEEFFRTIDKSGKPVFSRVYISEQTQKPTVSISIYANRYIIVASLNLSKITNILLDSKIDAIENVSIVDENGIYLVDGNYDNVEQRRRFNYFDDIKLLELKNGSLTRSIDGNKILINFTKLEPTGWNCIITVNVDKAYSSFNQLKNTFIIALLIMIMISSFVSFASINKINTALLKLVDKCKHISMGNYSKELHYSGYKEFEEIFENFNIMKNNIHERTMDLLNVNESLAETNAILEEEISERMKVEEELRDAKIEAESANNAKSQFLANMSHEIRTPMNGILGMTQLALMSNTDNETREYLSLVKTSAKSLLVIINDVLDYSKIEAGKIVIENTTFNIRHTLNEILALFCISAKQKSLDMDMSMDEKIPDCIYGDPIRLRQVLSNLIGNAIKFTAEGKIEVVINCVNIYEKFVKILFIIKDTGIGIPEDKRGLLFQRFNQLDSSLTKQFQGTGLGLVISKKLVELMGGTIDFKSELNKGSEFFFTLDFKIDKNPNFPNTVIYNASFKETNKKKLILIVEDDTTSSTFIEVLLSRMGYNAVIESNGKKAVEAYYKYDFDMIIMDVNMPIMNGIEATIKIREIEKLTGKHTPIIATTAYALYGDREKCIDAGMDDYISKPIEVNYFRKILNSFIKSDSEADPY